MAFICVHWQMRSKCYIRPSFFQFVQPITLYSIDTHFDASTTDSFENIVGKEEIARNEQFLLFPQCFLLNQVIVSQFVHIFDIISIFAVEFGRAQNWQMR